MFQQLKTLPKELVQHRVLQVLSVSDIARLDSAFCCHEHRPNLLTLICGITLEDLDDCEVSEDIVRWIVSRNINFRMMALCVDDHELISLVGHVSRLVDVSFDNCEFMSDAGLAMFFQSFHSLQNVYLNNCRAVSVVSVAALVNHPDLACVGLSGSPVGLQALELLVRKCSKLKAFDMTSWDITVDDDYMVQLLQHCPQLVSLKMDQCEKFKNIGGDRTVLAISQCVSTELVELFIGSFQCVSPDALITLAQSCTALLVLEMPSVLRMTDAVLLEIAAHCTQLTSLKIDMCPLITDVGIGALAQLSLLESLQTGNHSDRATDVSIIRVLKKCTHLRKLRIGQSQITEQSLQTLVQYCPQIKSLELIDCGVCEVFIINIVQNCRCLTHFSLPDMIINNAIIMAITECCAELREFCYSCYSNISEHVSTDLKRKRPLLRIWEIVD